MSVGIRGLHFNAANFTGPYKGIHGTVKTKLAILAFLYCEEFVNSEGGGGTG